MILLRKAHIYDVRSNHHNTVKDVLIEKGVITKISKKVSAPSKAKVISSSQLCISPGWLDIGTVDISGLCLSLRVIQSSTTKVSYTF